MSLQKTEEIDKLINQATVHKQNGDLINAEECLKKAIEIEPKNIIALINIGNIYSIKNELEKAKSFFLKAISIKPDYSYGIFNLALVNEELGNIELAIKLYKDAIKNDPENLGFYYNLSRIDKNFFNFYKVDNILEIVQKKETSNFNKASGFFILAQDQKNKNNLKKEFKYLIDAHKYFHFSNEKINNQVSFYWIRFLPKIIEKLEIPLNHKFNKIKPIFITGLPRSGSTLIESIISSGKRKILNGGETAIINRVFLDNNKKFFSQKKILDSSQRLKIDKKTFIKKVIDQYQLINLLSDNNDCTFTDKSLENFFFIELIIKLFPESKIIICKRNILQIIMSIYQNFLPNIKWAHSMDNILEYIDNYFKIIKRFEKKYSDKVYIVELDELTRNTERLSKDLFKFCDLEWDKRCLEFYKREDLVSKTASNQQIRSKIFISDENKYIAYKQFLQPYSSKYEWLKIFF